MQQVQKCINIIDIEAGMEINKIVEGWGGREICWITVQEIAEIKIITM